MQLLYELYAESMFDNYAYSSFEHIDRDLNIHVVMKGSGFDDDWTLLLSGKSFWLISYLHDQMMRSMLTESDIVLIDEYPPKPSIPVA